MPSSPERPRQSRGSCFKAAYVSAALNAALMALQIVVGLFAHSDGLVADGIHTLSDLAADGVVLAVLYLAAASAADQRGSASTDGGVHGTLASLLIGLMLIGTSLDMLWHCLEPSTMPSASPTVRMSALAVALLAMLSKEALFRYMRAEAQRTDSAVLHASAWHARLDAVSALVAALGVAGGMAGVAALDHVAAAVIGLMILRMGYSNAWSALKALSARPLGNTTGLDRTRHL
jgi:cation diffusion facilitator family transporter